MKQEIGNVGLLDLMNATEESVQDISKIGNIGMVLYRKETAHLLSKLSTGNIGKRCVVPEKTKVINGSLTITTDFLDSVEASENLLVNGMIIIEKEVTADMLKQLPVKIMVNGAIYTPPHLSGIINSVLENLSGEIETYEGAPPRFENGVFTLSNSFLHSLEEPIHLSVKGVLEVDNELDLTLFDEKIDKIDIKGVASLFASQEPLLYKKTKSMTGCTVTIIPDGYDILNKQLRLNSRSVKRFKSAKIYTKKPVIFEKDISREQLEASFTNIHTRSIIICHEELEDLVYERCDSLETEVLTYENSYVLIEDDDTWGNDHFLAFDHPVNLMVKGKLTLEDDAEKDILKQKLASIDLFGELRAEKTTIPVLQNLIRVKDGALNAKDKNSEVSYLQNIGMLTL